MTQAHIIWSYEHITHHCNLIQFLLLTLSGVSLKLSCIIKALTAGKGAQTRKSKKKVWPRRVPSRFSISPRIFRAKNPHRQQSSSQLGAGFDVETFNQDLKQRGNYIHKSELYLFHFFNHISFILLIRITYREEIRAIYLFHTFNHTWYIHFILLIIHHIYSRIISLIPFWNIYGDVNNALIDKSILPWFEFSSTSHVASKLKYIAPGAISQKSPSLPQAGCIW